MTTQGRSNAFRRRTWLERATRAVAPLVPDVVRTGAPGRLVRAALNRSRIPDAVLPGGERIRLTPALRHLVWNPDEYAAFRAAVRPGDVVLDVGANVGCYTVLFARWTGPTGRVHAFEPSPASADAAASLLALNGQSGVATVERVAVSDREGRAAFRASGTSGLNALVHGAPAAGDNVLEVPVTSLDAFCSAHGIEPRVLKIDAEGAELEVLRGARRILARRDVEVFVEFHPSIWRSAGTSRDGLAAEIAAQGFRVEPLTAGDPWDTEGVSVALRRP